MKVRFYSIQDLCDEVTEIFTDRVLRMQFLTRTGGGSQEQILTLSVIDKLGDKYYYSQLFFRCHIFEAESMKEKIAERTKEVEELVKTTFKGWTIKKGVYELDEETT